MATTKMKPIYASPVDVLVYVLANKVVVVSVDEFGNKTESREIAGDEYEFDKEGIGDAIAYTTKDKTGEIVYHTRTSHHKCAAGKEIKIFRMDMANGRGKHYKARKAKNGKEVVCYHLIQSFYEHEADPQTANEIGLKLAKEVFGDYAVTVSTHTNTQNIHNHLVICAWAKDGHKLHDCIDLKRQIRKASDGLCEQYSLSVLEATRDMTLLHYTDEAGVRRMVEVTDRKRQMWERYEKGIEPVAKANDYRQSEAYKSLMAKEQSNRENIKEDIDLLLPYVSSYAELISRLRDMRYQIKDKKANGDYRQHVTFQAPGQQKGTRDYKLGDGIFYTRERLEAHISGLAAFRAEELQGNIIVAGEGKTAVERNSDQNNIGMHIVGDRYRNMDCQVDSPNSEPAYKVIADTKETRAELDKAPLDKSVRSEVYIERLRQQISNNVKVLSFIEDKGLHSYNQINGLYKSAYDLYIKASGELLRLDNEVYRLEKVMMLPQTIKTLETRLISEDTKYESIETEMALLAQFKDISDKYRLNTPEGTEKLNRDIENVKNRIAELKPVIAHGKAELGKYEMCVRTLDRIDRKNGIRDEQAIKEHNQIKAQGRRRESGHENTVIPKGYER